MPRQDQREFFRLMQYKKCGKGFCPPHLRLIKSSFLLHYKTFEKPRELNSYSIWLKFDMNTPKVMGLIMVQKEILKKILISYLRRGL